MKLSKLINGTYEIVSLDLEEEILEKLERIGLNVGSILTIREIILKDSILIEINNICYALRKEIANNIIVKKV